jgi:hypothetical protein
MKHIPDGGRLLVLYGTHVGVNEQGTLGLIRRRGMAKATTVYGSLLGYLGKLKQGYEPEAQADPLDIEQGAFERA